MTATRMRVEPARPPAAWTPVRRPAGPGRLERRIFLAAVALIALHVLDVGEMSVAAGFGGVAWIVAVIAAAVAYRRVGAPVMVSVLLGLSLVVVSHPPPIGPIGLVCFAGAVGLLVVRGRSAAPAPRPLGEPGVA